MQTAFRMAYFYTMRNLILPALALFCFSLVGHAQLRPAETTATRGSQQGPPIIAAKYEGGLFGYSEKITGSLRFDDDNERLVFLNKDKKEMFGIPYDAVLVAYPNSRSVTSTTGNVVRHIPLPGAGLAGLLREKRRYLVIQFDDPDVAARGVVNFKIGNKALLDAAIRTLGNKAGLTQRGDAYYRPNNGKVPF